MPTLITGEEVSSTSKEWQMESLARHVLAIKPLAARRAWLEDYGKKKPAARAELEEAMFNVHEHKKKGKK